MIAFTRLRVLSISIAAAAALAGCSAAGTAPVQSLQTGSQVDAQPIVPDATGNLLYVADLNNNAVYVYTYPGGVLQRTLTGFQGSHGECVDAAGDVFVTNGGKSQVLEYRHGGRRPIQRFSDPNYFTLECAVNPVNGDLAVAGDFEGSGMPSVAIYKKAQRGTPTLVTTPNVVRMYFIGYDAKGNLFVDGTDQHTGFELAEIPADGSPAKAITLNHSIYLPGAVQWDGHHLAIGDQASLYGPSKILQFDITDNKGIMAGETDLTDSCDVLQFWIHGDKVVAGNICSPTVQFFRYPQGGASIKTLSGPLSEPLGVAVSPGR